MQIMRLINGKTSTDDVDSRVSYENGTDGATSYFYAANGGELERTSNLNGGTTITTYYGYELWDDAKITAIQAQGYNPKLKKNNRIWRPVDFTRFDRHIIMSQLKWRKLNEGYQIYG